MSDKMSCNVIRDILPSYIDGVCSEESAKCVEEHLASCAECREIYEAMKEDMGTGAGAGAISVDTEKIMKEVGARIAADTRRKTSVYRAIIIAIVLIVVVLFLPIRSIPADKMDVSYQNYLISDYMDKDSGITANEAMNIVNEGASILLDDDSNPDEAIVYLINLADDRVNAIYADEKWIEKHEYISVVEVKARYDIKSFAGRAEDGTFVVDKAKTSLTSGEKSGYSGQVVICGQAINDVKIK